MLVSVESCYCRPAHQGTTRRLTFRLVSRMIRYLKIHYSKPFNQICVREPTRLFAKKKIFYAHQKRINKTTHSTIIRTGYSVNEKSTRINNSRPLSTQKKLLVPKPGLISCTCFVYRQIYVFVVPVPKTHIAIGCSLASGSYGAVSPRNFRAGGQVSETRPLSNVTPEN